MSIKNGRGVGSKLKGHTNSRKQRRAYTKCRKHDSCRHRVDSIWLKR